jgi:hypothetical protein
MGNEITAKDLPNNAYFILKKCLLHDSEAAEPFAMPFPDLNSAAAYMTAVTIKVAQEENAKLIDNVMHIRDDEGVLHKYATAIIYISQQIVFRPGDDVKEQQAFNDIIQSLDVNKPDDN